MTKRALFIAAACLIVFPVYAAETVQGEYAVEITPEAGNKAKGTDKSYTDTIVIKDGKLMTEVSKKQGFKEGEIEVTVEGEKIKIKGTLKGRGSSRYEIELVGDTVSGRMIWDCDPGSTGAAKHAEYGIKGKKK